MIVNDVNEKTDKAKPGMNGKGRAAARIPIVPEAQQSPLQPPNGRKRGLGVLNARTHAGAGEKI